MTTIKKTDLEQIKAELENAPQDSGFAPLSTEDGRAKAKDALFLCFVNSALKHMNEQGQTEEPEVGFQISGRVTADPEFPGEAVFNIGILCCGINGCPPPLTIDVSSEQYRLLD